MDAYATHIPMLVAIAIKSCGPILEMGCGHYSTFVLHELCKLNKRKLVSSDEKKDWLDQFKYLTNDYHSFHLVDDWASFSIVDSIKWGMVFVDHAPGERRKIDIDRLKNNADFLVVHDSEAACYGYEPIFSKFKYRFDYNMTNTGTTVLSNFHSLKFLNE